MARTPIVVLALAVAAGSAMFGPAWASSEPAPTAAVAPSGAMKVGEETVLGSSIAYTGAQRREIRQPGATYIKVHFESLKLAPGDYVTVADPTGREVHTYHGDPTAGGARTGDSDFTRHGRKGFAAMSIDGEAAVVTLHKVGGSAVATRGLGFSIDRYWRGYSPDEVRANNPSFFSICGTDARRDTVCYKSSHPTEYAKANAVARLLISGGSLCTAWRVGNTNRVLTNNHCISTQSAVSSSEVQFAYACATCGGNNPAAGTKVSGATFYKTSPGGSSRLDYTLFSVNNFASIQQFGTLYLDPRAPVAGERIYIPGHGDGKPKRLSIYEEAQGGPLCTVRSAASDSYNMSYSCDTSGGNSGSPVLAANHKVIALHHLGGCPGNQGARINLIYNEIKDLIDNTARI
ncbi:V8-like Glu-specific endopeptidase [Actinokineospora baliensis]|uniref:trypsin-like serine peptidase n=1 Tax=Actinokineospora baliensis TaxID=547056 RepID=UPI0027DC9E33|nr:serine protease [Actinokineospora baliensis]MBM7773112.1 V8-like Glu-specific endopeptidase [Actinokineospora baliensis]